MLYNICGDWFLDTRIYKLVRASYLVKDAITIIVIPTHLGVGELQVLSSLHFAEGDPSSWYPLTH